jgi:D-3-phosphoglycerate dehydrogenase
MTFRVLVTARSFANTDGVHQDFLRQHDCTLDLRAPTHPYSSEQLRDLIPGYDGVILGLDSCDASVIKQADVLRVISRYGAGFDAVDLEAAARKGIAVTNTPGANQNGVAELAIGLLFALARNIPAVAYAAREGVWKREAGWELCDKSLGVVGLGAIGRSVAQKAAALGMKVLAYDPFWKEELVGVARVNLDALFAESDVITLHCALTPETTNLINGATLSRTKRGVYLINTARGDLVDEAALLEALKTGQVAGAAADVFRHDPPKDSPLLKIENFIATPHIGATTRESVERTAIRAARNLVAVLRGEPCEYIVNASQLKRALSNG